MTVDEAVSNRHNINSSVERSTSISMNDGRAFKKVDPSREERFTINDHLFEVNILKQFPNTQLAKAFHRKKLRDN